MINSQPLLITVDTNVLLSRVKEREAGHENAKTLLSFDGNGLCDICVTTRVDRDVQKEPLRSQIASLPVAASPIGSNFVLDESRLDSAEMLGSSETAQLADDLKSLLFPYTKPGNKKYCNNMRDVSHLVAHKIANRDVFVTDDTGILDFREELVARFGIRVMGLEEIVQALEVMADSRGD